jgi:4'-phosphopantetheinyl transferase
MLDGLREYLNYYTSILSDDELARMSKYAFARDRVRFAICRGILRELLGRYLSLNEKTIEIKLGARGKPALVRDRQVVDLRFNLSHSHGFAVLAFTIGRELGVDTELIRFGLEVEDIAQNYFSSDEQAELSRLKGGDRAEGFFLGWTGKEAYVKARGEGLQIALDSFSVSLIPGVPARLSSQDADRWSLHFLTLVQGWAAALVVEGAPSRIIYRDYVPDPGKIS